MKNFINRVFTFIASFSFMYEMYRLQIISVHGMNAKNILEAPTGGMIFLVIPSIIWLSIIITKRLYPKK